MKPQPPPRHNNIRIPVWLAGLTIAGMVFLLVYYLIRLNYHG